MPKIELQNLNTDEIIERTKAVLVIKTDIGLSQRFGRWEMYPDGPPNTVKGKILKMLDDMYEDKQRAILKNIEKEKFIEEILEERRRAS